MLACNEQTHSEITYLQSFCSAPVGDHGEETFRWAVSVRNIFVTHLSKTAQRAFFGIILSHCTSENQT